MLWLIVILERWKVHPSKRFIKDSDTFIESVCFKSETEKAGFKILLFLFYAYSGLNNPYAATLGKARLAAGD